MRTIPRLKYSLFRWIFSKVIQNTIFTIILTIAGTFIITNYFSKILAFFIQSWIFVIVILAGIAGAYFIFSYEKILKKVKFKNENLGLWSNNEFRLPAVATIMEDSLFLQLMDIPFTLNYDLPSNYALEFKSKALVSRFAWCVGARMDQQDMHCYMFQYDKVDKKLNPHILVEFDNLANVTKWVLPGSGPLRSVPDLKLASKDEWYFTRTEVRTAENRVNVPHPQIPDKYKIRDESGGEITYDSGNINLAVEIKIFDMYDLAKLIYHMIFTEPPLKCYVKGNIGFRNYGFETALYKDVKILRI